jgi:predicted ferric reductase
MAAALGPPGLEDLYDAHRYSSLLVVCLILIYTYRTVIWKARARRSLSAGEAGIVQEREGVE